MFEKKRRMAMENMEIWNQVSRPPKAALKAIRGGRLSGMTDIDPMWRFQVMTEIFGPVGTGWKYTIDRVWTEPAAEGQVFAFAQVSVYYRTLHFLSLYWSEPVQGLGGSMLLTIEKRGKPEQYIYADDEAFKKATTDALGTALKHLGVAADIYAGRWDGSKYKDDPEEKKAPQNGPKGPKQPDSIDRKSGSHARPPDTPHALKDQKQEILTLGTAALISKEVVAKLVEWFIGVYQEHNGPADFLTIKGAAYMTSHFAALLGEYEESIDGLSSNEGPDDVPM